MISLIELNYYGIKIRLRFDFFAAAAFMTALADGGIAALGLLCCLLHEFGHIAVMTMFGAEPSGILFYGAGIMITPDRHKLLPLYAEALILSAGCALNFLLSGLCGIIGERAAVFGYINLFLGIFNLIPAPGLDGGRLLELFLGQIFSRCAAHRICKAAGCVSAMLLASVMFRLGARNFTVYAAAGIMMIASVIM